MENSLAPDDRSCHGVVVQQISLENPEVSGSILQALQMGCLLVT
jgi:hypothetical protein